LVKRNHKQCHDDGLVIEYYSNGGSCEGYYQGGVEEGAWRWWDENGNKQKACHYKEGLKDGLWTEFSVMERNVVKESTRPIRRRVFGLLGEKYTGIY